MKKRRETLIKYLFVLICLLALTACGQAGSVGKTIPEETPSAETLSEETPTGDTSGSGGVWDIYYLLRWSEEKQEYESIELPWCDFICYEDHKLHGISIDTPARQYYSIDGLQNGEYQEEKELALLESRSDDDTWVLTVEYSEYGEIVETTDLSPVPDWKETKSILKEKYPEFIYWWGD